MPKSRKSSKIDFPARLPKGKMLRGPDYFGCLNTGLAPTLLHSRVLSDHPAVSRGYRFVVGPELFVETAVRAMIHGKVPEGKAYFETDGRRVTFSKTYRIAKQRFQALRDAIVAENAQTAAKVARLRKRAAKGNMAAVLALSDYI